MAGLALIFDTQGTPPALEFKNFLETTAGYKSLEKPDQWANGKHCLAAKLDSPSSLHRGIVSDHSTGSWITAVGSIIGKNGSFSGQDLLRLLVDYLAQGSKVFAQLDGHFALAIYDCLAKKSIIVSDPLGVLSIYYGQKGNRVFVSTSALAVAKAIQSPPDELGVRYFLMRGTVLGEMTLWQYVKRLPPANAVTIDRENVQKQVYRSFSPDPNVAKLSLGDSVDYVVDLLSRTMKSSLPPGETCWLSLTGGLDSRLLAAIGYHSGIPFRTYCHGQPDSGDVRIAGLISQEMGWEYDYYSLPADWGSQRTNWFSKTLGLSDGHLEVVKTSRIVREQTLKQQRYPVSLWGFGGETYRGYHWKQEFYNAGASTKVNYDRLLDYRLLHPKRRPVLADEKYWTGAVREEIRTQLVSVGEENPNWINTLKLDLIGIYLEHSWGGAHLSSVLGLQRVLLPFDYQRNISGLLSLNWQWRTNSRLFRLIFEKIDPVLAETETTAGGPALPMRLSNLHKFVPYWYGQSLELAWRLGHKFFAKDFWRKRDPGKSGTGWPVTQWRKDTLQNLEAGMVIPARMHSANLYDGNVLNAFLNEARGDSFSDEELLNRIITIEMACRSIGTAC